MKIPSLLPKVFLAALLFGVGTARSQNAPDKLVFAGDSTLVDSLRRTDYPYLFPIWGDKVRKMGIALPLSAGIGVNYMWGESELVIDNLSVGFNNGPMTDIDEVVRIDNGLASVSGVNVRPDLWVLPFLNVYGILGAANTSTAIDAGLWLPDSANNWGEVSAFSSTAEFDVQTFGFGVTPTAGLGGGWVALDMNFTWTDVSALEKPAFAFVFGPRFGKTFKLANPGQAAAIWVGAFRLNISSETSGSIDLAEVLPIDGLQQRVDDGMARVEDARLQVDAWWNGLSAAEQENPVNEARYEAANRALGAAGNLLTSLDGALSNADGATVQYSLNKAQAKMWNFIVGGQFQLSESLQFRAEYGFLGERRQFIGGIQYRFGL